MYEQSGSGLSLPSSNLQVIQGKSAKFPNGRQLRRRMMRQQTNQKSTITTVSKGFQ